MIHRAQQNMHSVPALVAFEERHATPIGPPVAAAPLLPVVVSAPPPAAPPPVATNASMWSAKEPSDVDVRLWIAFSLVAITLLLHLGVAFTRKADATAAWYLSFVVSVIWQVWGIVALSSSSCTLSPSWCLLAINHVAFLVLFVLQWATTRVREHMACVACLYMHLLGANIVGSAARGGATECRIDDVLLVYAHASGAILFFALCTCLVACCVRL